MKSKLFIVQDFNVLRDVILLGSNEWLRGTASVRTIDNEVIVFVHGEPDGTLRCDVLPDSTYIAVCYPAQVSKHNPQLGGRILFPNHSGRLLVNIQCDRIQRGVITIRPDNVSKEVLI